ncbi:Permease [Sulfidibacter corallicola]|uniref:Permease n=1 Tax=Sulfidibacter corallicola TaxID=2818388 RepID=A0A8A4TLD9_SULCO|nr:permease [Sulfidibacter corallicola]QTD50809.1 permease [Sulfidibacter corallicola]
MFLLLASLISLLAGPLVYRMLSGRHHGLHLIDGFIFVAIGGLVLAVTLPESLIHGGWPALLFLAGGALLPTLSERFFHRYERQTHLITLILAIGGLLLRAMADGATLTSAGDHGNGHHPGGPLLAWGILLHSFPIGLTVWWFVRPSYGARFAAATLGTIALGSLGGFYLAPQVLATFSTGGMALFQAFVGGTLLHVVFHRPHARGADCGQPHPNRWFEGTGNLLGCLFLIYLLADHLTHTESAWLGDMAHTFVDLARESAPALLLAYVLAGIVSAFMPDSYVKWIKKGRSLGQSMRGMLVGLPLPVCSCGVVPLYHTLIRKGAPPTAAMAFLIATPELGLDAVLLSLPLLGGEMTLTRVLAAALVALVVGVVVGRMAPVLDPPAPKKSCCNGSDHQPAPTMMEKLRGGLKEGLCDLVDHTGPWILVGLLIAAVANPLLSNGMLSGLPDGLEIPIFALLGMPVYVCAAGATPLIAVFLMNGVSPGAALAFLLTGPATNVTTFGVLRQLHGKKAAFLFGLVTLTITVALGFLTNAVLPDFAPLTVAGHEHHWAWYQIVSLVLLVGLYLFSLWRRGARTFFGGLIAGAMVDTGQEAHSH